MNQLEEKFSKLATDNAPGQELRQKHSGQAEKIFSTELTGTPVDFSHGDVNDTAFAPTPGSSEEFIHGTQRGGEQAYTESVSYTHLDVYKRQNGGSDQRSAPPSACGHIE